MRQFFYCIRENRLAYEGRARPVRPPGSFLLGGGFIGGGGRGSLVIFGSSRFFAGGL